ncbi:glycine--tRNA ligase subunit beta [Acetobacteraceae bacterium]|nr:glycine--tRNA ligase subunit beta [Acetobacteraceae bacterium]
MAELFLELISEQIPSRFQKFGAERLGKELISRLSPLSPKISKYISDPRRIGCVINIKDSTPEENNILRGPKISAPAKALEGFSRKCGVSPEKLEKDETHYFFKEYVPARSALDMIAEILPTLLWEFPWPKAMRWGGTSRFSWVRPLHKIVCLLDGKLIPFSLERDGDKAHGLKSDILSEDGPFGYQEEFKVSSAEQWEKQLRSKGLIPFHEERLEKVKASLEQVSQENSLKVMTNEGLLNEVTGLCEIPTAYLGKIDPSHMELPHEVRDDLMGEHQRYFPLSKGNEIAPFFAFVANHPFEDNQFVSHGNERVLRARLEDGRHFWDQDRKRTLESRVDDLKKMIFQEKLGDLRKKSYALRDLSGKIAEKLGYDSEVQEKASRAGFLLKADLLTEMVGELPSLQGIMGGYYAEHDKEAPEICEAIRQQYLPKGNSGEVPNTPVSICTALADRLYILVGFFSIGLIPTGSGDPYGLRRMALGIFRILQHNQLQVDLGELLQLASEGNLSDNLEDFLIDRLRIQLRQEGIDAGITEAVLNLEHAHLAEKSVFKKLDGQLITEIFERASALQSAERKISGWAELCNAYRRAGNILQAEIKKGWQNNGDFKTEVLRENSERNLFEAIQKYQPLIQSAIAERHFDKGISELSNLHIPIDRFFEEVLVNDPNEDIRTNRLLLLSEFVNLCNQVADFSKIEKKS